MAEARQQCITADSSVAWEECFTHHGLYLVCLLWDTFKVSGLGMQMQVNASQCKCNVNGQVFQRGKSIAREGWLGVGVGKTHGGLEGCQTLLAQARNQFKAPPGSDLWQWLPFSEAESDRFTRSWEDARRSRRDRKAVKVFYYTTNARNDA